jgi:hypothetical protein
LVHFGESCKVRCCCIYGHLVYFTAICYILWPFVIFCGNLVYFWYFLPRNIWHSCFPPVPSLYEKCYNLLKIFLTLITLKYIHAITMQIKIQRKQCKV